MELKREGPARRKRLASLNDDTLKESNVCGDKRAKDEAASIISEELDKTLQDSHTVKLRNRQAAPTLKNQPSSTLEPQGDKGNEDEEDGGNPCIIPSIPSTSMPSPSPFDAVLAAANMASESLASVGMLLSSQPPSRHGSTMIGATAPIRIAPNGAVGNNFVKGTNFGRQASGSVLSTTAVRRKTSLPKGIPESVTNAGGMVMGSVNNSHLGSTPSPTTSATSAGRSGADKGLRHFSTRVCAKVEEKGATTYNEVADELVLEIGREVGKCDHKNIRRRVYDALNVLMAIDVIRKDKKDIRWLGIPNEAASEMKQLEEAIASAEKRIQEKRQTMAELIQRLAALKNLINRNSLTSALAGEDSPVTATSRASEDFAADRLHLPFILINAPRDCRVHCEMLEDRTQYFFEFDSPFLINEDIELLRLMGLDQPVGAPDATTSWLPPDIAHFMMTADHSSTSPGTMDSSDETAVALLPTTSAQAAQFMLPDLDDWDAHHVDALLESMPPAVGGLAGLGFEDFPPVLSMSSPIKGHSRTTSSMASSRGAYNLNSARPVRPFRTTANPTKRS